MTSRLLQPKTYEPAKSYELQTALSGCLPEAASLIHRACTADTCSRDLQQRLAAEPLYSLRPLLSHAPLSKTSVLPPPLSPIHSYRKAHAQQTVSCDNTQREHMHDDPTPPLLVRSLYMYVGMYVCMYVYTHRYIFIC